MVGPLDEQYFTWLYAHIASTAERNPSKSYWVLCKQLYEKEFVWIISGDANRAEDGRELRQEFYDSQNVHIADDEWKHLGCSIFELLVGLSRRLAFYLDGEPAGWFWEMIDNLGLSECTDVTDYDQISVDEVLDNFMWRTYSPNGTGGLFPLKYADEDQRHVEIWYQLNAYSIERF